MPKNPTIPTSSKPTRAICKKPWVFHQPRGLLKTVSSISAVSGGGGGLMDVYIVAAGGFMFIAESAVRLRIYRGGERTGHSVAWGVARGIELCEEERIHRVWANWFPHLIQLVWLPLGVAFAEFTFAQMSTSVQASRLLYLFGYLLTLQAVAALILSPLYIIRMTRRIRDGKLGFVSERA
jgi:hypothetical protein